MIFSNVGKGLWMSGWLVLLMAMAGCVETVHRQRVVSASDTQADLIQDLSAFELGSRVKVYEVPLILQRVPLRPRMRMQFRVISTGICHFSYTPTTLEINGRVVKELDFRTFRLDSSQLVEFDIPAGVLVMGSNTVRIHTGDCRYDIDALELNQFQILNTK